MRFIRNWIWKTIRWVLFHFDAETAHQCTVLMIRLGIRFGNRPLRWVSGAKSEHSPKNSDQPVSVLGLDFQNRIGLAAGFDKNAEILVGLPALGFGFAEIGTVTPKPQSGNPRPRLFRNPEKEAVFNRMGFNGLGATIVSHRLREAREHLPSTFRVGVNIGKNKDTPLEDSSADYVKAAREFEGLADYLVINVSSPNTPGLRSLQTVNALRPIVLDVNELISGWKNRPPLLLKIAPEVSGEELVQLVQEVERWGIDGWVLTNTLAGALEVQGKDLAGGWSGGPVQKLSRKSLIDVRRVSQKTIISVGGIVTAEEAVSRFAAGADLIQIYTGWIYRGPSFPAELAQKLSFPSL